MPNLAAGPDLPTVVERVTHAFHAGEVSAPSYGLKLEASGSFVFTPRSSGDAITFEVGGADWHVTGNTAQSIEEDGIVRHLEARRNGAFLTWIIPTRPAEPTTDLAVNFRGLTYAGQTENGHHFAGKDGVARVRFGNTTAIDSAGFKWPVPVLEQNGKLIARVSSEILASALYPLAIDPEISAEEGIDVLEPVPVNPNVQNPAIVSNGEIFLVAWESMRVNSIWEIRGTRLTVDGAIADPAGLKLSWPTSSAGSCILPSVGSDGTNFLVAWVDHSPSNSVSAAIVGANGAVRARSRLSSYHPTDLRRLAIASDGSSYLVAWQNGYVRGRIVPNDSLSNQEALTLSTEAAFGDVAAVWNGSNYAVAWKGNAAYFRRINKNGTFVDPVPRWIGGGADVEFPNVALAWSGGRYFMAWSRGYAMLDAEGNPLWALTAPGPIQSAVWDGSAFWTLWQNQNMATVNRIAPTGQWLDGEGKRVLRIISGGIAPNSVRLARAGDTFAVSAGQYTFKGAYARIIENPPVDIGEIPVQGRLLSAAAGDHAPVAAPLGENHLVVWSGASSAGSNHADIRGARVASDGTLLDPIGFTINGEFRDQLTPAVASIGNEALVVWEDWNSSNANLIGARIAADATIIGGASFIISGESYPETAPAIAAAHDRYLVVWDRRPVPNQYAIGSLIYAPGQYQRWSVRDVLTPRGRPFGFLPKVASDGTDFLVTWHSPYLGMGSVAQGVEGPMEYAKAYAARVSGEGALLDSNGFLITSHVMADQLYPVAAFGGGNYLAAWMQVDNPSTLEVELWAAPIFSDGRRGAARRIATGNRTRWSLTLAGNAAGFFASWRDKSTDAIQSSEIKGAYLNTDGSISDEGAFLINGGQFTWNPALSVQTNGSMLIASEASRPGAFRTVWNVTTALEPPLAGLDGTTGGDWKSRYAGFGQILAGDSTALPSFVQLSISQALGWTWADNPVSTAAMQRANTAGRVAACWYSPDSFEIRLTFNDQIPHLVAFYLLDWDTIDRAQSIEVFDAASGALLHTLNVNNFNSGKYLLYELSGDIRVRFTRLSGYNAVLSAILFPSKDAPLERVAKPTIDPDGGAFTNFVSVSISCATPGASIFYTTDGSDPDESSFPYSGPFNLTSSATVKAFATKTGTSGSEMASAIFTRTDSTTGGARLLGRDIATRGNWIGTYGSQGYLVFAESHSFPPSVAASLSAGSIWTWNETTDDPAAPQRSADPDQRIAACAYSHEFIEIRIEQPADETRQVAVYALDWDMNGRTQIIDIMQGGSVAASETVTGFHEGEYLIWEITGPATVRVTRVSGINAVISGIFIDPPANSLPTVSPAQISPPGGAFSQPVEVSLTCPTPDSVIYFTTDGSIPTVSSSRYSEPFVISANCTVTTRAFKEGMTPSPVSTADFAFSGPGGGKATFSGFDNETGGSWRGSYGASGYAIAKDETWFAPFASFSIEAASHIWAYGVNDLAALQMASSPNRIASCWYGANTVEFRLRLTDNQNHILRLYFLDWDGASRSSRVEILDGTTGTLLDSQEVSGFSNGSWLRWTVSGELLIRMINVNGPNWVFSGAFLD